MSADPSRSPRSEPIEPGQPAPGAKASARSVLAAPRRPIARYRPVVIGAAALAVLLLVGLGFLIAFGGSRQAPQPPADPAPNADAATPAPIGDRLPASYGELGPPPATLLTTGSAQAQTAAPATTPSAASPGDPARQRRGQEQDAAQRAGPFFAAAGGAPGEAANAAAPAPPAWSGAPASMPAGASEAAVSPKEAFIARASAPGQTYVAALPQAPLSPYELKAGSVIAAAMITALNSDLPGMAVAQVTEPVFDHRTGRIVLIPQGARLVGRYDSQVGYGQERVLVVWTRLIFPSGRSVELGGMSGADATGAAGLTDQVDAHLPRLARAIGLSTLISIGASAAQNSQARGSDNLILQDGVGGVAGQASQTGQRLVDRDLQRAPTLRIRPGYPVRVMVDKDLILPPEVEAGR